MAENRQSPGYKFVRELKAEGVIDEFKPIAPEDGYTSEYSLDDGLGYIRFNDESMLFVAGTQNEEQREALLDLERAVAFKARELGFTEE